MFHTGRALAALALLASSTSLSSAAILDPATVQGEQPCAGEFARAAARQGALIVDQKTATPGSFATIGAAVAALKNITNSQTIFIKSGTYPEQVYIPPLMGPLMLQGYTCDYRHYKNNQVTITSSINRNTPGVEKNDQTATLRVWSRNVKLYNLNILNMAPPATVNGQGLALNAAVGDIGVYACTLRSWQDTVLVDKGRHLFAACNTTGNTDFIFGTLGLAWFEGGVINPLWKGYITADGRKAADEPGGILLNRVNITGSGTNMTYLGRPWKEFARVRVQNSYLGEIVKEEGWSVWNATASTADVTFEEFNNTGPGSKGKRADFSKVASSALLPHQVLGAQFAKAFWFDPLFVPADFDHPAKATTATEPKEPNPSKGSKGDPAPPGAISPPSTSPPGPSPPPAQLPPANPPPGPSPPPTQPPPANPPPGTSPPPAQPPPVNPPPGPSPLPAEPPPGPSPPPAEPPPGPSPPPTQPPPVNPPPGPSPSPAKPPPAKPPPAKTPPGTSPPAQPPPVKPVPGPSSPASPPPSKSPPGHSPPSTEPPKKSHGPSTPPPPPTA